MLVTLLLSVGVALIMVSTIRLWGNPPVMNRVLVTTALGAMVSFMVIRTAAAFTDQNATLGWSGLAVLLMSVFLLKTGWDYTKPSKR